MQVSERALSGEGNQVNPQKNDGTKTEKSDVDDKQ